MNASIPSASVYTDLKGLDQLKHTVKGDSIEDLRIAARQFEAIFIQQMLKTMRNASLAEGVFDSNEGDYYMELLDKQLSLKMSEGRGIGLADIIVQQLSRSIKIKKGESNNSKVEEIQSLLQNTAIPKGVLGSAEMWSPTKQQYLEGGQDYKPYKRLTLQNSGKTWEPLNTKKAITDPERFIKTLWPLAKTAAKQINVEPHVLIAQAALETGWGQFVGKDHNGNSSHNLFNIRADANWQGDTITVATTEFRNGKAIKGFAAFRAYDSYNESFMDYVAFIKSNPQYKDVLTSTDSKGYVSALYNAGCATDPGYPQKIMNIANGQTMAHAMAALKI